jgi:RND family efflux transporter MFP subunit
VLGVAGCHGTSEAPKGPPLASVTVTTARRMTVPIIVTPIGTTRALEEVKIRARVRGFLTKKNFEYGQNVKKDQLLLVIDELPFKVQLARANAQLAAAEAALAKAKASKAPEVARARVALSRAQLRLDEIEERRERTLVARKAASQEDYDKADAQRKKSAAQVEADEASAAQAVAEYDIDIASANADVASAVAAVKDADINLGYCRMTAPIEGRIGELQVKVGNLVGDAGLTDLVTIQQLQPMGLDIFAPARYLPVASALMSQPGGVSLEVTVEGERPHPHPGKMIFIDNHVNTTTSTFLARAQVPNPAGSLLPGQYIKATFTIGEYVDAVVVPEQAVVEGQEGTSAFVVDAANQVQFAKVKAVDVYQGLRVLESGIEPGQRVIVEGIQLVRPGQVVTPDEVPLDRFIHTGTPALNVDPRYNSRISRIPGMESQADQAAPEKSKPAGEKSKPTDTKPASPPAQPAPDPTAKPDNRTTPPAAQQAR